MRQIPPHLQNERRISRERAHAAHGRNVVTLIGLGLVAMVAGLATANTPAVALGGLAMLTAVGASMIDAAAMADELDAIDTAAEGRPPAPPAPWLWLAAALPLASLALVAGAILVLVVMP